MNFCSNCGAPAGGGSYCANCGQSLSAGSATQAGGSGGGEQTVTPQTGDAATPAAGVRAANPFSDIPVIDYVRDAAALVLLLVSFGMPWDLADSSTGKVYVILAALLSIASLTLPYLKRGGILPTTWGTAQLRLARLAANAPYVVVVLVTVVLAYVGENGGDGVGVGVAFGLAGAILAAQGRQTELEPAPGDGALWRSITLGVAGLFALISVLSLVMFMADFASELEWAPITLQILIILFFLAVPAMPLLSFLRGQHSGRDALLLVAVVGLFVGLWQMSADGTIGDAWSLRASTPGILLFPALGAAAAAAGVAAHTKANGGSTRWVGFATQLFYVTLLVGAFGAVTTAVQLVDVEQGRGAAITVVVLYLLVVVAALVGRNALVGDPDQGRAVALGAALVFAVLGVVIVSVLGASDLYVVGLADATMVSVLWWFAIAILFALTTPKSVRDELGPVSASTVGLGNGGAGKADSSSATPTSSATTTSPTAGNATPTAHPTTTQAAGQTPGVKAPEAQKPQDESASKAASDSKAQDAKASEAKAEEGEAPETKTDDAKSAESTSAERKPMEMGESTSGAAAAAGAAGAAALGAAASGVGSDQESSDAARARDAETSSSAASAADDSPYRSSGAEAEKASTDQARTQGAGTEADASGTSGARGESTGAAGPEPVDSTAVLPQTDAGKPSATERSGADDSASPRVVREAGFDSKTAADPDTPLQTLADIAAQAPSLRPYLAANPSTYPELVEWLRHLGDPAVDEALRRRNT